MSTDDLQAETDLEGGGRSPEPPALTGRHRRATAFLWEARPKQWTKNCLVFAAPCAAGVITHHQPLQRTAEILLIFCAVAAGTYFLNDSIDAEADRRHPTKRNRPIAAGLISVRTGITCALILLAGGIAGAALLRWQVAVVVVVYVVVQLSYCFYLKNKPVYDISCVAAGFVIRAIAGAVAAQVPASEWFLIVATFGSLLLVTGKRLAEQMELGEHRSLHRATLEAYSPTFLRTVLAIAAGGAMVSYCLWAFALTTLHRHAGDTIWYQLSIIPMIVALLRYTFLVEQGQGSKPEDLLFSERSLIALGAVWLVLFGLGVYV